MYNNYKAGEQDEIYNFAMKRSDEIKAESMGKEDDIKKGAELTRVHSNDIPSQVVMYMAQHAIPDLGDFGITHDQPLISQKMKCDVELINAGFKMAINELRRWAIKEYGPESAFIIDLIEKLEEMDSR